MHLRRRAARTAQHAGLPPRPYLPPVCAAAGSACAAAVLLLDAGWQRFAAATDATDSCALPLETCAVALVLAGVLAALGTALHRRRGQTTPTPDAGCYLQAAALGCALALCASPPAVAARANARSLIEAAPLSARVIAPEGDPTRTPYGFRCDAHVLDERGQVLGRVSLTSDEPWEPGVLLKLVGRFEAARDGSWDRQAYYAGQVGEVSVVRVLSVSLARRGPIEELRSRVLDAIDPSASSARALIAGIVCGRVTELADSTAQEAFARTGTSHLIAVSGSHLAVVTALLGSLLAAGRAQPLARTICLGALMAAYVAFTGGESSAVRSFIMVTGSLLAQLGLRRPHGVSALALTVLILIARDPVMVYDLGFQLSALSVLFILLFFGLLRAQLELLKLPEAIAEALGLTLCALWATVPITVATFGEVPPIAPLANLALAPVMTALLVTGLICTPCAALLPGAEALVSVPEGFARLSIFLAEAFARLPFASLAVDAAAATAPLALVLYGSALMAYACWHIVPARAIGALVVAASLAVGAHVVHWTYFAAPAVTVLDVGQGDAILVRDGSAAVLVDCGVDEAVRAALARQHVFRLDAVVITHWDRDHWGGLETVLACVPVDRLIVTEGAWALAPAEATACPLPRPWEMRQGDCVQVGGFTCRAVWPAQRVESSENGDSLVWDVRYADVEGELSMLLTGDTEADEAMRYAGQVGDIDVLKLGHHGSAASVDAALLDALDPELAIASAGAGNRYGHPSTEAVDAIEAHGSAFLCTIDAGDIVVSPGSAGVSVSCAPRAG